MSMGALALTCLTMVTGQLSGDVFAFRDRAMKIPIRPMQPERVRQLKRMILYVSQDQGKSWMQEMTVSPESDGFIFRAPRDGHYWFKVAAVNKAGKEEPSNIYKSPVDQKILVDTTKPLVQIQSARREGEEVVIDWIVQERYPELRTLELKYRPAQSPTHQWKKADFLRQLRGQTRVRINEPGPLTFRLEMKDAAGNLGVNEANVSGALATASFQDKANNTPMLPTRPGQTGSPDAEAGLPMPTIPPPPQKPATPPPFDDVPKQTTNPGEGGKVSWSSDGQAPKTNFPDTQHVAARNTLPKRQALPTLRYVNQTEVVLAYELSQIQPGRVGGVELWMTRDDGRKWTKWMRDEAVKTYMHKGPHTRTLELPGEGVYGLSIVVRNLAGKGKEPQSGDAPEMRIEVDLTPPEAVLYPTEPNKYQKKSLGISWEARDRNMTSNPVTLEWSEQASGPWKAIAANLPNTGKYSWQPTPSVPPKAFVRIRIRDKAGNETIKISTEPQLIDLSEPQGRLLGIMPPTGGQ